jgi:hypothetical protein
VRTNNENPAPPNPKGEKREGQFCLYIIMRRLESVVRDIMSSAQIRDGNKGTRRDSEMNQPGTNESTYKFGEMAWDE